MERDTEEFFEVFPWSANLETGIPLIDEQHQQLVRLLNRLAAHLADRSNELTVAKVFDELTQYVLFHFSEEEAIWDRMLGQHLDFEHHLSAHRTFIQKVESFKQLGEANPPEAVIGEVLGFLTHWLAYHILDSDRRMAKTALAIEAGMSREEAVKQTEHEMSGAMKTLIDTVLNMYDSLSVRTLELLRERTARRQAEAALKVSEERWQFVLDGAGEGVWDWNIRSGEVFRSTECAGILELLDQSAEIQSEQGQIHPEDIPRLRESLMAHLDGQSEAFVNEHRIVRPNGAWSWVLTRGKVTSRDRKGRPIRMIGTHTDITERELAVLFFQNTREGMFLMDRHRCVIRVNRALADLSASEVDAMIGMDFTRLCILQGSQVSLCDIEESLSAIGQWQGHLPVWHRTRGVFPAQVELTSLPNPDGSTNFLVGIVSDRSRELEQEARIWRKHNFDELTGLPNRQLMHDRLQQRLSQRESNPQHLALMILDIERLRDLNSVFGHLVGDRAIQVVAEKLSHLIGTRGVVGRIGGDEFGVVIDGIRDIQQIDQLAQNIIKSFDKPTLVGNESVYLACCIGIAMSPEDGNESETLLKCAEQAMYDAKQQGRNRFAYFAEFMQHGAQIRLLMASDLRRAIAANQFVIHVQPIIDLASGEINKAEVLVRWQHPEHGLVSPATFIPIAEESGVIVELGEWVFTEACKLLLRWRKHRPAFQLSVNKSPVQVAHEANNPSSLNWAEHLRQLGLPGESTIVEITESVMMNESDPVHALFQDFRRQGLQIALDDFGTGYSSLSYLQRYPIDYIKIDRSFVTHLTEGSSQHALCEAMIVMAHKLGLKVVAEGIETPLQRKLLERAGCDYGQGYLFARPMPVDAFEQTIILADFHG